MEGAVKPEANPPGSGQTPPIPYPPYPTPPPQGGGPPQQPHPAPPQPAAAAQGYPGSPPQGQPGPGLLQPGGQGQTQGSFQLPPPAEPTPVQIPAEYAQRFRSMSVTLSNKPLYLFHFVRKWSSKGAQQDRIWVLVPRHMLVCDSKGRVRRAMRLCHIDRVFLCRRPQGPPLIGIRSASHASEPTLLLELIRHPDNHPSSHADPLWPLHVLNSMRIPQVHSDLPVEEVPDSMNLATVAGRREFDTHSDSGGLGSVDKREIRGYRDVNEKMAAWQTEPEPHTSTIPGYRPPAPPPAP
eukprot:Hpha_TRINITY_DN19646_c0_g1::TRINITY_DN19646_c0_g1_i1::g.186129::m.186129